MENKQISGKNLLLKRDSWMENQPDGEKEHFSNRANDFECVHINNLFEY